MDDETEKKIGKSMLYLFVMAILILIIVIGCSNIFSSSSNTNPASETKDSSKSQTIKESDTSPVYDVKVNQLEKEFESNQIAAKQKYGGKIVSIEGYIRNIDTDILGSPYIMLGSSVDEWDWGYVQCMFKDENNLVSVSKNDYVKVKGRVSDESIGNLIVRDCSFLEQNSNEDSKDYLPSGPFDVGAETEQKDESAAILACSKRCVESDGEYQSHMGTDVGSYYILTRCNCWRD